MIIEDDVNLGTTLQGALEMQDYKVSYLTCGDYALTEINSFEPDIIILDVMLNGALDGFELARKIRFERETPILFTTSGDSTEDLKEGFEVRNSDYVRKPYKFVEVTLRMANLLSGKNETSGPKETRIGSFFFNHQEQSLKYEAEKINLSASEAAVLNLLCQNTGDFIKRTDIVKSVWNEDDFRMKEATLNNIVSALRKYLSQDRRIILESRIGLGVRLLME